MLDVADFIDWPGDGTGTRYELIDGVLRAMAPGIDAHNTIIMNLGRLIGNHLAQHRPGCRVVAAPGVQPRVRAEWNFRVPDLGVTCAPNKAGDVFTPDPILLIEVLSPSNAADTYESVRAYATLPSVKEILVVHSTRIEIEVLLRGADGNWPANPTNLKIGTISLESIRSGIAVTDIYANTHLIEDRPA
jgi:Uma2 family endonuclease